MPLTAMTCNESDEEENHSSPTLANTMNFTSPLFCLPWLLPLKQREVVKDLTSPMPHQHWKKVLLHSNSSSFSSDKKHCKTTHCYYQVTKKEKCKCKDCPGLSPNHLIPIVTCGIENFPHKLHHICYEKMLRKSLQPCIAITDLSFCTFQHHDKYLKSPQTLYLTWQNDDPNNLSDSNIFKYYLIMWLSSKENYCIGLILLDH